MTLTKERPSLEEDNVLINKFREQNPFEEGDEAEVDSGAAKERKPAESRRCRAAAAMLSLRPPLDGEGSYNSGSLD